MAEHFQEIKSLVERANHPSYPLHLPSQGNELLPTHLQWLLLVDHEPETGCYSMLFVNKRAVLEIPDDKDRYKYAPRIAFFHNERRDQCQCVDFRWLGVPYTEIVHMDKVVNKSARILANRWFESGFDVWAHYQNLWAGVVAMALSPRGRPSFHKQIMMNFNYDWPRSFCELVFLDLWQHGANLNAGLPRRPAIANNDWLGLYKEKMQQIAVEATVRDARRRGNDYALFFAKEVCRQSELILMRRKHEAAVDERRRKYADFPEATDFVPTSDRFLARRQSTGGLQGLPAQLLSVT